MKNYQKIKAGSNNISFDEIVGLLKSLGYTESNKGKTSGSRIKFINYKTGKMIYMHRPHPRKTLLQYQVRDILNVIGDEI
ncbi:type II toxin-antitoxin system HicA family toxin [Lactobacillus colini]|uniref:type II toxin-antitoxin system HicA family toxin n=1 Tax=Lactobacillus colini TaxID=1819254 RepID=UPI001AE5D86E